MVTKLQLWGNSLGLRIPKSFAAEVNVEPGAEVDLSVVEGRLIVEPIRAKKVRLADLLEGVDDSNLHDEVGTGAPVGREVW